jgi:hypothetical protein
MRARKHERLDDGHERNWLGNLLIALTGPVYLNLEDLRLETHLAERLKEVLSTLPGLGFNALLRPEDIESISTALAEQVPPAGRDVLACFLVQDKNGYLQAGMVRLAVAKMALRVGLEPSRLLEALLIEACREEARLRLELRQRSEAML